MHVTNAKGKCLVLFIDPPMWSGGRQTLQVSNLEEGGNVTLECDVCMDPWGDITWIKHDRDISHNSSREGYNITIEVRTDSDLGKYICTASNVIQNHTHNASFSVLISRQIQGLGIQASDVSFGEFN